MERVDRVLLVGDSHDNPAWWHGVVMPVAEHLDVDVIVQLGDFGWWPHAAGVARLAAAHDVPTWFIDGNHEHHDHLAAAVAAARAEHGIAGPNERVPLAGNLSYLPRGARFALGSATVACAGGARSIDRAYRTPGVDWFLAEALADDDLDHIAIGPADVLLSHDAPAGWEVPGLLSDAELSPAWRAERPACQEHRDRLREAYEVLRPRLVAHGHYHSAYHLRHEEAWGVVEVHGLDCDGARHSLATLTATPAGPELRRVSWDA